ncbi:MAG: DUF4139 domain-containing protein [Parasphingopyxis sp.]|uniref:DUF4139 domain-containing protein n=1 Tax=Parasphingopyxis sp. TaxID=1920299 RepID=UPI003FA06927
MSLGAGRTRLEFPDVSAQIRPETVTLGGDGIAIVEQNFDYDLLSPAALMENAVGEQVTLISTNPATGVETRETATILSVNNGVIVEVAGRIEVLRDDGRPVRVVFDQIPPNLRADPTLSVTLDSRRAGRRPLSLSYLTPGLGWSADYVALYDAGAGTIDVQGWVTLTNTTGTTFDNADTILVAGTVEMVDSNAYRQRRNVRNTQTMTRPGTQTSDREQLGDFYLYPLAERTTIADRQTKQVNFLDVQGANATNGYAYRVYGFNNTEEAQSADSILRFSNSRDGGLGDALPAGIVRVYMRDARGDPQFIGESAIGHTPMGSELALTTGRAFDVNVETAVVSRSRMAPWHYRTQMRYTLSNARPAPVRVQLDQRGLLWRWPITKVVAESQQSEQLSADGVRWEVDVPANGTTEITATFDTRY